MPATITPGSPAIKHIMPKIKTQVVKKIREAFAKKKSDKIPTKSKLQEIVRSIILINSFPSELNPPKR